MNTPPEDGRLQTIINLLRCHVFGTGCPNFAKYNGAVLNPHHLIQFEEFTSVLHLKQDENTCSWCGVSLVQNQGGEAVAQGLAIWNPNIPNGANKRKGRTLRMKLTDMPAGYQILGVVSDRGINFTEDTMWVVYRTDVTANEMWVWRIDLTDNDGTTWDSGGGDPDTFILQPNPGDTFRIGSRGQFGGTSGIAPFNLVPKDGRMTVLGINKDGRLVCATQTKTGQDYMILYDLTGGTKSDLVDISGRADYDAGEDPIWVEDPIFASAAGGIRSLVPLYTGLTVSTPRGSGDEQHYQYFYSPILFDDERHVLYYYPLPCNRYGGMAAVPRMNASHVPNSRDVVVLNQDHIRDRLDNFGIKNMDSYEMSNVGLDGVEPLQNIRGQIINPGINTFDLWNWLGTIESAGGVFSTYGGGLNLTAIHGLFTIGFRNLVIGKMDFRQDGGDLTDQDVIVAGGKEVFHLPDAYIPNGYQFGALL